MHPISGVEMDDDSTPHPNSVETPRTNQPPPVPKFSPGVKGKQPGSLPNDSTPRPNSVETSRTNQLPPVPKFSAGVKGKQPGSLPNDSTPHPNPVETSQTNQLPPVPKFSAGVKGKQPGPLPTVWDHFIKLENDGLIEPRYECNYCGEEFSVDNIKHGDSILWNHLTDDCENNPHRSEHKRKENPSLETSQVPSCSGENSLEGWLSIAEYIRACSKMMIIDELPFTFVERKSVQVFMKLLRPDFDIPSPVTLARDAYQLYLDQKKQLKSLLFEDSQRVCLTTQTWTSMQQTKYMALKVHFIDSEWELHKKMLNFCEVPNDNEETVGEVIASCLVDWGIERVLTVSVEDANDAALNSMKMKLKNFTGNLLDGECLHMRCYTHIVNSIVHESLIDVHESIDSIRNAVKYVSSSPEGLLKFEACIKHEKIECKGLMVLDVPTRWNTTYLMLRDALKFQKAFEKLEEGDEDYGSHFLEDESGLKMIGPPTVDDWENVRAFVWFLKIFYDATLKFGASGVTSNICFDTMCSLRSKLTTLSQSQDSLLGKMATSIKTKYDKYWGSLDDNKLLIVSVVLDPRFKLDYVAFCFGEIYGDSMVEEMEKGVKELLFRLYEVYSASDSTPSCTEASNGDQCHYEWMNKFLEFKEKKGLLLRNEVDRYLSDSCENTADNTFDMLHWWKVNSTKYGMLSRIARDVFAIPVSTMASSESAFSTRRCVLNKYWSSYPPSFVQALMCSQDWLRSLPSSPVMVDDDEVLIEDAIFYKEIESEFYNGGLSDNEGLSDNLMSNNEDLSDYEDLFED
ncbi:zinc finger BED domain-containing protein RICESLEEPER 2-like isoform X2 [Malus sylvestris]|uniref:zinc finger BED domain-containing protein RICESLEEPER 2-like isoform X2 n=1 Tax=Malus sylvestris TaxID=3752 RepID=UPI0021AC1987|nr:zinc finger BED domain-containing protein RICESLEEPER 2-like isoform X2 [Malus sylvestris]